MPVRGEAFQQFSSYTLCRRMRQNNAALRFKGYQLIVKDIILFVADLRRIQCIVVIIILIELCYKLFHGVHNIHPGTSLHQIVSYG
ncbi:hypothetical protein D3C74_346960 [compost metagenome]